MKTKKRAKKKAPEFGGKCLCTCSHKNDNHTVGGSCMGVPIRFAGHEYEHAECGCKKFVHSMHCQCNSQKIENKEIRS